MSNLVPERLSAGVFELISALCDQESKRCASSSSSPKRLSNKMRSHAYEIILKKSSNDIPSSGQDAVTALLTYYLINQQNPKNVIDFKHSVELKKVISTIRHSNFGEHHDNVHNVLKFLVALGGSVEQDSEAEIFQKPFTFGLLDQMLSPPPQQSFGSVQPYPCYPASIFQLPYSIRKEAKFLNHHFKEPSQQFSFESINSQLGLTSDNISKSGLKTCKGTFLASLPSTATTNTYYSEPSSLFNIEKLSGPRDLRIPKSFDSKVIITLPETTEGSMEEVYIANPEQTTPSTMDIWEIATQIDKNIPDDIWEIASKLPPQKDRQLIATSSREMRIWKETYSNQINDLNIISEKQFVRHVMYLLIGIETSCFPYNSEANCFQMKPGLILEGISREVLTGYVINLLLVGSYYRRLYDFAFNHSLEDQFHSKGLVYEAGREVIRRYLLNFRMKVSEMYDERSFDDRVCMPTLLQILYKVEPLKYEIETIVSIYKLLDTEFESSLPVGAELMSYLFSEISLVTNEKTAQTMFSALFSICKVYFKFIEMFIFEGELNDLYHEFFIRKDSNYVNCRSKKYWDKGFHITRSGAIPEFLRSLAKLILLCGKSLRLLKLCNPSDPLILLISSDHPSVKGCASFEELERQQELLDVYRTRCLFVSGEPVTFDQILLKKEADRKAFTEMASLKQAETLEKIIAERKRLAQLIIAEKQHSLRVLEAAMAEAKAAKMNSKYREKRLQVLEQAAGKATEEVDSKLKEDERNKMMEYYSKLNMEVEKSKIHSEWKIKRLQLDQSRIQLLSTEERNLRREKIELQHKQNEECMAMSIQSIDMDYNKLEEIDTNTANAENAEDPKIKDNPLVTQQKQTTSEFDANKHKNKRSNEVFTAICNVAKSLFGVSNKQCDNEKELDAQGNIVSETDINLTSDHFEDAYDNEHFVNTRHDALVNKQKGMGHELTRTDHENNSVPDMLDEENNYKDRTSCFTDAKKNKLKVLGTEYNLAPIEAVKIEPKNDAQIEAILNKEKILGTEYNLPPLERVIAEPKTDEHRVALLNKEKILGTEFYSAPKEIIRLEPQNEAQREAVINRDKILGTEFYSAPKEIIRMEPQNEAQREAVINRDKILGTEFYSAPKEIIRMEPQNEAQREAVINRDKILGTEFYSAPKEIIRMEPQNEAQREAVINRDKILGTEFYSAPNETIRTEPQNEAQREAIINRDKILGTEFYSEPIEVLRMEPQNEAQREAVANKEKILGTEFYSAPKETIRNEPQNEAQREAIINKDKILGTEFYLPPTGHAKNEPQNDAQRQALLNKQKILGVEFNLPPSIQHSKEPMNYAQEEAIKNKEKTLKGEFNPSEPSVIKRQPAKRSNLTLNLTPFSDTGNSTGVTPNIGALTPAEFYPRLDLETPTTGDVPFGCGTGDMFPHQGDVAKDEDDKGSNDNKMTAESFDFTLIVEDTELSDLYTPQNSPVKNTEIKQNLKTKYSFFDIIDGTYSLDDFDPFGVKELDKFSSDYFTNQMNNDMNIYSHPAQIMSEVKKKPYENIFIRNSPHLGFTDEEQNISNDNIATLTACLQRSVMLPLTYQLEVVNNSILTYFLVNLDMYEHMRSLKDYFFLMDGEFSRSICHNLFSKLGKTLNPEELLNFATLHNILDKALGSSISHIHKFSENLSFTISDTPLSFHHSSPDILQCLSLTYTVSWPLNIILSQEALTRYAKVFQFLVKMRRISWVLSEGFESLKLTAKLTKQNSRKLIRSPQYISIQIYRHNMASLIRSLDNYIVTTCILSSWTEYETDLKKARTLDDLYECHVVYIKKVLFRCLLNNRSTPVMKLLNDIFTVILKFTRVLKAGGWQQTQQNGEFTHSNHVQLVELYYLFEKLAKYLHKVITKLTECGYQRHLVELLTLINLNQYYDAERSKDDTNTSVQSVV